MKITDKEHFKGSNKMTAMLSYYYRLLYSVVHSPNSNYKTINKNVKNFEYGEHILYGRVLDITLVPVLLHERLLLAPKAMDPTKPVRVVNFVADAFNDFTKAFETAQFKNQISMDAGFLTSPIAKKGYVSPTQSYKVYRAAAYEVFMKYMNDNDLHPKIRDFDTFYDQFHNYFKLFCTKVPFTLEAFHRSGYSDVRHAGLAIDLAEFDASEDKIKVERVFENKNYRFYENAAMQFGFRIDLSCPWRLVADLGSPAMIKYMKARGFRDANRVMNAAYEPAYLTGYNAFKTMVVTYYNSYVQSNPATIRHRRNGLGDYVSHKIERIPVDIFDLISEYGERFFLEKYVNFRSMENESIFTPQKISLITDRALELAKIRGMEEALKYINEDVCKTTFKSGSIAQRANKNLRKSLDEEGTVSGPAPGTMKY